jgi:hypothetical protein
MQPPTVELHRVTKTSKFLQLRTSDLIHQVMNNRRPIQTNNKWRNRSHTETLKLPTNLTLLEILQSIFEIILKELEVFSIIAVTAMA